MAICECQEAPYLKVTNANTITNKAANGKWSSRFLKEHNPDVTVDELQCLEILKKAIEGANRPYQEE